MVAFTQDTWLLNLASRPNTAAKGESFRHYARIELPAELTQEQAQARAKAITTAIETALSRQEWSFSLTRWELRGHDVSF